MKLLIDSRGAVIRFLRLKFAADAAINGVFREAAQQMEAEAKLNAPWTDRTGNARRTLTGVAVCRIFGDKMVSIEGRMYYSPNLELYYGGKYSILLPTLLADYRDVLQKTVDAVEGVKL